MQIKKNDKVNLEKKKFLFFEIGLILSLAICLVAFEWSSKEVNVITFGDLAVTEMLEEEILTTEQDQPEEEIIEPDEVEPETIIEELTIVDDDKEVENVDFNTEATEETKTVVNIVKQTFEEPVEEEVEPIHFAIVEEKPEFPGGDAALLKFIADNTKYPEIAKENGVTGTVYVQFVIDKDGKVTKVTIARSIDPYLDAESLKVVRMIPPWKPGKQRGKSVPVTYLVPIKFNLQ